MNHRRCLLLALIGLALLAGPPRPVAACSQIRTEARFRLQSSARNAQVIAVGEVTAASERTLTLRVEEYWKGAERAPELSVNNRPIVIANPDCSTREGSGPMLRQGTRLVAFLVPDRLYGFADWQFAGMFSTDSDIPDNLSHSDGLWDWPDVTTMAEARGIVLATVGANEVRPPDPAAAPSHPRRATRLLRGVAALITMTIIVLVATLARRHRRRQEAERDEERRWLAERQ